MTLQNVGKMFYPQRIAVPTYSTQTLDSANERAAFVFQAPRAGNIIAIGLRLGTISSAPSNAYDFRLETLDTSTGDPSGTLWGTNTNGSVTPSTANAFIEVPLTSPATVAESDFLCSVVVAPATGFGSVQISDQPNVNGTNRAYRDNNVSGVWSKSTTMPVVALKYDDGTYSIPYGCVYTQSQLNTGISPSTSPDEIGVLFSLPFKARLKGVGFTINYTATNPTGQATLYDGASNVLASASYLAAIRGNTGFTNYDFIFSSPVTLEANTDYRAAMLGVSGSSFAIRWFDCSTEEIKDLNALVPNWEYTERTDLGAWSELYPQRYIAAYLILDQIDYSGSGSYTHGISTRGVARYP